MGPLAVAIALWVGAPSLAADAGASLTTLAAASSRPSECAALLPRPNGRKPSVWKLVRMPTLGAYCDHLAKAHALLASDPKAALVAVDEADRALPDRASAAVARGRALLGTGDTKGALQAFQRALELDARSIDEPKAMNDYARTLVLADRAADAATLYRELVPRAELLPDGARPLVYLQAAHALMAHAASSEPSSAAPAPTARAAPSSTARAASSSTPQAPSTDLADAAAYLAEARSSQSTAMRGDVLLSLALVFDRAGDPDKAAAAIEEAERIGATLTDRGRAYVGSASDAHALAALALEARAQPSEAEWTQFLEASPPVAWVNAAKAHLAKHAKKGGGDKAPRETKRGRK